MNRIDHTKIWAAAVLMIGGLGMIGLGGCFLIGVMLVVSKYSLTVNCLSRLPDPIELTVWEQTFVKILYGCAFTSFGGGGMLIMNTVKKLNH